MIDKRMAGFFVVIADRLTMILQIPTNRENPKRAPQTTKNWIPLNSYELAQGGGNNLCNWMDKENEI